MLYIHGLHQLLKTLVVNLKSGIVSPLGLLKVDTILRLFGIFLTAEYENVAFFKKENANTGPKRP